MQTYAAQSRLNYDVPISGFFWGALIVFALVVAWILAGKAIGWLRNRRKFDGVAAEGAHPNDPEEASEPWDQAISNPLADQISAYESSGDFAGMNQREEEEFFSTYGDRKVRKAMTKRRRAREAARKKPQSES